MSFIISRKENLFANIGILTTKKSLKNFCIYSIVKITAYMILLIYIYSIYILTVFKEGAAVAEAQKGSWLLPAQLRAILMAPLLL